MATMLWPSMVAGTVSESSTWDNVGLNNHAEQKRRKKTQ
jgi:hypothetical protein